MSKPEIKLDPYILKAIKIELKAHDLDIEEFEDFEDFFKEIDVINAYEEEWNPDFYRPYYAAIYTKHFLELEEAGEAYYWKEPEHGGQSPGDEMLTNGWED
jgi:hypothetical protein